MEEGDRCATAARTALLFVEQMDVIAAVAAAGVQIFVDGRPSLVLEAVLQIVKRRLVIVANDHHVGDEVGSPHPLGGAKQCHEQHHDRSGHE